MAWIRNVSMPDTPLSSSNETAATRAIILQSVFNMRETRYPAGRVLSGGAQCNKTPRAVTSAVASVGAATGGAGATTKVCDRLNTFSPVPSATARAW